MMTTAENSSGNVINADNSDNISTANSNICVNSINDNSHDYFSFDMYLVLNYTNNQIIIFCFKYFVTEYFISSSRFDLELKVNTKFPTN